MVAPTTAWMLTASGRKVHPAALRPEDVCIEDIAHHLAHQCRFAGASREFYSTAQHSLLVAALLAEWAPDDALLQLCGLLHDAPEYLLGDLVTPVKEQVGGNYRVFEAMAWCAIAQAFELPLELPAAVKRADLVALAIERRDLIAPHPDTWPALVGIDAPAHLAALGGLHPRFARRVFLERFQALRTQAGKRTHDG